jgi:hypothetical protein
VQYGVRLLGLSIPLIHRHLLPSLVSYENATRSALSESLLHLIFIVDLVLFGSLRKNSLFFVHAGCRSCWRGLVEQAGCPGRFGRCLRSGLRSLSNLIFWFRRAAGGKSPFQWKTIPQGAATSAWAGIVASADEVGGRYCENCHVSEIVPGNFSVGVNQGVRGYAIDPNNAEALWKKSEELVGESF